MAAASSVTTSWTSRCWRSSAIPFGADPTGAAGKEGLTTDNVEHGLAVSAGIPLRRGAELNRGHALRWAALSGADARRGERGLRGRTADLDVPRRPHRPASARRRCSSWTWPSSRPESRGTSFAARDHAQLARSLSPAGTAERNGGRGPGPGGGARPALARAPQRAQRRGASGPRVEPHGPAPIRSRPARRPSAWSRWTPTSLPARALLGEIQLELGAYREAARTFGTLLTVRTDLAVAPRYARWEEIRGRPAEARQLLRDALKEASGRHGMPRSQLAWFHWRLGDLALAATAGSARRKRELEHGLAAGAGGSPSARRSGPRGRGARPLEATPSTWASAPSRRRSTPPHSACWR